MSPPDARLSIKNIQAKVRLFCGHPVLELTAAGYFSLSELGSFVNIYLKEQKVLLKVVSFRTLASTSVVWTIISSRQVSSSWMCL